MPLPPRDSGPLPRSGSRHKQIGHSQGEPTRKSSNVHSISPTHAVHDKLPAVRLDDEEKKSSF